MPDRESAPLETSAYYVDFPGVDTPIAARLVSSKDGAVQAAIDLYRTRPDLPKVVVCEYPSLGRVVTISGPRSAPRVIHR